MLLQCGLGAGVCPSTACYRLLTTLGIELENTCSEALEQGGRGILCLLKVRIKTWTSTMVVLVFIFQFSGNLYCILQMNRSKMD